MERLGPEEHTACEELHVFTEDSLSPNLQDMHMPNAYQKTEVQCCQEMRLIAIREIKI